ncbi:MAG: DUF885 domain-containing protein [Candidatus Eremiobacteraeota bacterium]|nr:DUF885 domain-containing protein [Candidatus Eremiobacteraeota bacterium]
MRYLLILPFCMLVAMGVPGPVSAQTSVHDRLTKLAQDIVYTDAAQHPMDATNLGIPGHDAELETPSAAGRAEDLRRARAALQRLNAIAPQGSTQLSLVDRDDATLLQAQLASTINALTVENGDQKDYSAPAQAIVGAIFTQFQHLPIVGQNSATQADLVAAWEAIIARLNKAPAYMVSAQKLVKHPGHLQGMIGNEQLAGVPDFFKGPLTDTAKSQLAAPEFARFIAGRDRTLATIAQTHAYIAAHVASWPENYALGRAAYDRKLHDEQLLPFTALDVERMGADELAHGWAEEAWLTSLSKQRGVPFGPASGGGLAPGGSALISYYRDRIAELRKFMADQDVVTVPDWLGTISVVETPSFLQPVSPGASMNPPRLFSSETTGYYFITPPKSLEEAAARLDMNEDFDRDRIWSTAAHEAMPGHFMQLSIAKRHPDFIRKIQGSGVFAEGWAFYGEEMFVRLGLYGDDLDGRLYTARWERVRGARAIVDPKLATGEWTYRQAADFFASQTGFSKGAADAAVAGIALGPGYVISYTVGRLQLENLLAEYMHRMGGRGSLHDFHDRLLSYGTTPFAIVGPELLADLNKSAAEVRKAANY